MNFHQNHASKTAEYMALFRAMESTRPENVRLFTDSLAVHFISPTLRKVVLLSKIPILRDILNCYADFRAPGARTSAIARTRFIDDALSKMSEENIGQVVILGAGFDCRAYRLACLNHITIFEVDHPATAGSKKAYLHRLLTKLPNNVRFVEIDFNHQSLQEALTQAGFDASQPAVFLWEGVTNYLTREAVDSVFQYVARCNTGSRIIFTYVHSGLLDGSTHFEGGKRLLHDVSLIGEPWTFGLSPEYLAEFLLQRGFSLECDLSANEYRSRYFKAARRMKGYDFYHVSIARVLVNGAGQK